MSIRVRGDKFQADITYGGKRYRETFSTKSEAEIWESATRTKLLRGETPEQIQSVGASITMERLQQLAYRTYWESSKSAKTMELTSMAAVRYFGPSKCAADISAMDILDYTNALKQAGNTGATCNRKLAALSKMLKLAHDLKLIPSKPSIIRQKESSGRDRFLSNEEEARLLNALKLLGGHDEHALTVFLLDTGARLGEALKLPWSDVQGDKVFFRETKNGSSRGVPLTSRVREALAARRNTSVAGPFVGMNPYGKLRGMWARAKSMAGLDGDEDVVMHILRHTFCSRLVQRGVPIEIVKQLAGHKSISTTLRYAHLAPGNLADAINVLETSPVDTPNLYVVSNRKS